MRRFIKNLLIIILITLTIFWITSVCIKYNAKQTITEKTLNEIIDNINTSPNLPQNFKDTYSKIYPGFFENNFTTTMVNALFSKHQEQCPSRQVANHYYTLFSDSRSIVMRKLNYIGFTWLLEEKASQEKCFEYYVSHLDFLDNTKGMYQASLHFYNKPLDSLSLDEQLGMILKIKNPSLYNNLRYPEKCDEAIKELKEKIKN